MKKIKVKRALISVYYKDKIVEFAKFLISKDIELICTEGTHKLLKSKGIDSIPVEKFAGIKESYSGLIKTIHPIIYASIMSSKNKKIKHIDLVVVNFYPYEKLYLSGEKSISNLVEVIDIGGPTLLRAASTNYKNVCPISSHDYYNMIMEEIESGGISIETRLKMAVEVFKKTSKYDKFISETLL